MKSRVEKYSENYTNGARTERNRELYKEVNKTDLSMTKRYSNSRVIDEANKEIDIEKIKKYVEKINEGSPKQNRTKINDIELPKETEERIDETRDYDLNSVLEKARSKREIDYERERSKRLNYSREEILSKIEKYKEPSEDDEDEDDLNTNEKTLVNLINTIAVNKKEADLFEDLKGNDNTQILGNINDMAIDQDFKEEIKKQVNTESIGFSMTFGEEINKENKTEVREPTIEVEKIDYEKDEDTGKIEVTNSFYTTSDIFDKNDFVDNEDDEDEDEDSSPIKTVALVIAVIVLLAIILGVANYVFNLGLF